MGYLQYPHHTKPDLPLILARWWGSESFQKCYPGTAVAEEGLQGAEVSVVSQAIGSQVIQKMSSNIRYFFIGFIWKPIGNPNYWGYFLDMLMPSFPTNGWVWSGTDLVGRVPQFNVRKEETESDFLYLVFDSLDWILLFSERSSQKPRYPEQKVLWLLVKHSSDTVHFFWYRQGKSSFMLKGICDRLRYLKQYLLGRGHVLWAANYCTPRTLIASLRNCATWNPRQLDDSECVRIVWNYI